MEGQIRVCLSFSASLFLFLEKTLNKEKNRTMKSNNGKREQIKCMSGNLLPVKGVNSTKRMTLDL